MRDANTPSPSLTEKTGRHLIARDHEGLRTLLPGMPVEVLPGVRQLVDALAEEADLALGLVT